MTRWVIGFILWSTCAFAQAVPMGYGPGSSALETGHVLKAGPGQLINFNVFSTVAGFVFLIDGTAVPANGAVVGCGTTSPTGCVQSVFAIAANSEKSVYYGLTPLNFVNGITVVFSTTAPLTMTSSSSALISGETR